MLCLGSCLLSQEIMVCWVCIDRVHSLLIVQVALVVFGKELHVLLVLVAAANSFCHHWSLHHISLDKYELFWLSSIILEKSWA